MIHWCLAHPWIGFVAMWILGMWIMWYELRQYKRRQCPPHPSDNGA